MCCSCRTTVGSWARGSTTHMNDCPFTVCLSCTGDSSGPRPPPPPPPKPEGDEVSWQGHCGSECTSQPIQLDSHTTTPLQCPQER